MWQSDMARQQYGLSEDYKIPEYMSRDPPEYQLPGNYTLSSSPVMPTYQQNTVMAEPFVVEGSYTIPYSVYRDLRIKIDQRLNEIEQEIENEH